MEYKDNPRKVYGKVEIIYSDEELSKDIVPIESENARVSHPKEVFGECLIPTVRACTMDRNCTMDGSFQMIDDSCVCGWWSKSISDSYGMFYPYPWIELHFVKRPIISWILLGDTKLNQYPVDFLIECKNNDRVVKTESVVDNDKIELRLEPKIEDITSIRLTIYRWSQPFACAKIIQFYDKLAEVYEGDALQMFEVTEELCSENGNYNINSDSLSVTLHNTDRKFDKGYLRLLMILDRKLIPSIGIERNGEVEYKRLGTYYSDEWKIEQDKQWVKCLAVDKLLRLQEKQYVGFPFSYYVSLYDIAEDIIMKAGYKEKEYYISDSLRNMIVPTAFLAKQSVWDALQEIANAGLCNVYTDRADRIVLYSELETSSEKPIVIHKGNTFNYSSNISLTEFANSINVDYYDITLSDELVEAISVDIAMEAYETIQITLDYTTDVAYPYITSSNPNIMIKAWDGGVNASTITLENTSPTFQYSTIAVTGYAIDVSTKKITIRDEDSVRNSGVVEFTHTSCELVQSYEHAEYIAKTLLAKMHAGEGIVTTVWRGNPELEPGNEYSTVDRFGDENQLICESNKFTYDGGLREETRGRKKIKEEED